MVNNLIDRLNFKRKRLSFLLLLPLFLCTCGRAEYSELEVVGAWVDMTLRITKNTPGNTPTYASRGFGYIGITMYESVVQAEDNYRSLTGQLTDLGALPQPEVDSDYHWPSVLNAGQACIIKSIYHQTSDENKASIDSLEEVFAQYYENTVADPTARRSIAYGRAIADEIFEWSKTDGGHRAYLANFDKQWLAPDRPGKWQPPLFAQSFSHHPLHPYWGRNRTFLPANDTIPPPQFLAYDTVPGSPYFEQFKSVYDAERALTQVQKEVAIWWGDDPDETFTPPGHSYYIAGLLVRERQPSLVEATRTFAATGMAVADAFIRCWEWKFTIFSERPNTFIPKYIDEEWESFWPDPPFPSFPSGHAIQAGAAMRTLGNMYGDEFAFTDRAHVGRPRDEVKNTDFKERRFESLWDVALETADSRFYGGIHLPIDNEAGLAKGIQIAANVSNLQWRK